MICHRVVADCTCRMWHIARHIRGPHSDGAKLSIQNEYSG